MARLPCTKPLATPAVVVAMPARQSRRACRPGDTPAPCNATRSLFVRSIFMLGVLRLDRRGLRILPCGAPHAPPALRTGPMTKIASNLQIDSARLWGDIHETAKFGGTPKGGVR